MSKQSDLTAYYQTISEMGRLEIARRRAGGETIGQAPLGFRKVQVNGKSTIAPDPETFPLLMLAFQMRKEGCTLREICSLMAKKGLRSKRGKFIPPNGMDKVLRTFGHLVGESSTNAWILAGRTSCFRQRIRIQRSHGAFEITIDPWKQTDWRKLRSDEKPF